MEKSLQYQTHKDPDKVQCSLQNCVQGAPSSHTNMLAAMNWRDGIGPTVSVVSSQLQKYEENLSAPLWACILTAQKLFYQVHHLEEHISSSSPR